MIVLLRICAHADRVGVLVSGSQHITLHARSEHHAGKLGRSRKGSPAARWRAVEACAGLWLREIRAGGSNADHAMIFAAVLSL